MESKDLSKLLVTTLICAFACGCATGPYGYNPALNPVKFELAPPGQSVTLVKGGRPAATVVVPAAAVADSKRIENLAAQELVSHLEQSTGAKLPVVGDDKAPADGTLILLGPTTQAQKLGISADALPLEGFRVRTFDDGTVRGLAIVGRMPKEGEPNTPEGVVFGVYDVLERFVGVRWYYPREDGVIVPKLADVVIRPVHYTDAPVRAKRTMYGPVPGMDTAAGFRRYRHGNSSAVSFTACHTPGSWDVHKDHPETFELMADGKRHYNMPCYGNPKTAELYLQDIEKFYKTGDWAVWKHPWPNVNSPWFEPTPKVIPISPPDKGVECHCDFCKALYDDKADQHGRASRIVANHVKLVAQEVKKRWPDKLVWYLPYANYATPPEGLELPDNVVVGLCLMYGAGNAKEPIVAAIHDEWIAKWAKITKRPVHLWEYLCWPADDTALPFQYPHVLKDFCQRHRTDVEGTFINGGAGPPGLTGDFWAFQHPTLYCWFRVMWNPDFKVDAALDEYVRLMYGPARKPMAKILNLLITRWENTRWQSLPASHNISPRQVNEETMPRAEALKLGEWLADARKCAGEDTVYRKRVEFFGAAIDMFLDESREYHEGTGVPTLPVLKVGGDPVIDGKLDEPCWRDATAQQFVNATDKKNPQPEAPTTVQAVWTERGITLGFRMTEPQVAKLRADRTKRDQDVFWDDCIESFLDIQGARSAYYQIVTNSIGTIFDRHSETEAEWNGPNMKAAAHRGEGFWSIELFLPYADFVDKVQPKVGDTWYANFTRSRFATGGWHLTRWSTKHRPSNLDFSAFGKLKFVE